jgi:hypothetical protein
VTPKHPQGSRIGYSAASTALRVSLASADVIILFHRKNKHHPDAIMDLTWSRSDHEVWTDKRAMFRDVESFQFLFRRHAQTNRHLKYLEQRERHNERPAERGSHSNQLRSKLPHHIEISFPNQTLHWGKPKLGAALAQTTQ